MDMRKLNPWNWFKHEEQPQSGDLPVTRRESGGDYMASPIAAFHRDIDRMFDDVFRRFGLPALSSAQIQPFGDGLFRPRVDVSSAADEYTITAELPGVEEKDVSLELLDGDTLLIKGEKKQEREEKARDYYRMERSYGSFQRVLALPADADANAVKARFKNGVLTVKVPRKKGGAESEDVRRISIET